MRDSFELSRSQVAVQELKKSWSEGDQSTEITVVYVAHVKADYNLVM